MQNVDFKCELRDPALCRAALRKLGGQYVATVDQRDTYYRVPDGRLKKRESEDEPTEYVLYHRLDRVTPKLSHFTVYTEEQIRERFGARELPVWLTVNKTREIYMWESAHVHLDRVARLGWFLEIDALVAPHQHVGRCHELIARLRGLLGPALGGAIATSYAELMALELELDLDDIPPVEPSFMSRPALPDAGPTDADADAA
jgi:adenylate cyclase class IV